MMIAILLMQSLAVAKYVSGLATRIAVLEAGHDIINEALKEIKKDVKELLRAVTS